jgi:hypothetical protein
MIWGRRRGEDLAKLFDCPRGVLLVHRWTACSWLGYYCLAGIAGGFRLGGDPVAISGSRQNSALEVSI